MVLGQIDYLLDARVTTNMGITHEIVMVSLIECRNNLQVNQGDNFLVYNLANKFESAIKKCRQRLKMYLLGVCTSSR
jgi:hypothetical protein